VQLRRATPEDAEGLVSVKHSAWLAHYTGLVADYVLRSLAFWRSELEPMLRPDGAAGFVLVAQARAAVDGYAALRVDPHEAGAGQLKELHVRAEREGRGIGSRLVAGALDHFRRCGKQRITLWVLEENDHARRFYEHRGFRPTGERQVVKLEGPVSEVRYVRKLTEA
jgi:ribosomal protein S18 acetylase RimI-like enzyme